MAKLKLNPWVGFILWILLGIAFCSWFVPSEQIALANELPGQPGEDMAVYQFRLYLPILGAFLPAVTQLIYCLSSTLDRYMLRQFLSAFALCSGMIFVIWLLVDFAENASDLRELDNPILGMFQFYLAQIPMVMNLILPYTLLLAVLWTLGKLSKDSELISMLQTGRSLLRLTAPLLYIGILVSLLMGIFVFHAAPTAEKHRKETLKTKASTSILYKNEDMSRIWRVKSRPRNMQPDSLLKGVSVEEFDQPGELTKVIEANSAQWETSSRDWIFYDARIKKIKDAEVPEYSEIIPKLRQPDWSETPWLLTNESVKPNQRSFPELAARITHIDLGNRDYLEHLTEMHLRWARAFSCLVLVLIAIPSGISFSRRPTAAGIGTALGLSAGMIFGFEVLPALGAAGYLPPWLAAWGTDIIFFIIGCYLFQQRLAHRSLKEIFTRNSSPKTIRLQTS